MDNIYLAGIKCLIKKINEREMGFEPISLQPQCNILPIKPLSTHKIYIILKILYLIYILN